ncbi:MAG: hypothetical protein ACO24H_03445 [Polynucleobacter sp.]
MTTAQITIAPEFFAVANGTALKEYWTQEFLVAEEDVYEDGEVINKFYFTFHVKEFYTDDEDMFGQPITSYALICNRRWVSGLPEEFEEEYEIGLGEQFPNAECAQEFAIDFVVPSFRKHLNFGPCPVKIFDPEY